MRSGCLTFKDIFQKYELFCELARIAKRIKIIVAYQFMAVRKFVYFNFFFEFEFPHTKLKGTRRLDQPTFYANHNDVKKRNFSC
jgi:hypothetical protein